MTQTFEVDDRSFVGSRGSKFPTVRKTKAPNWSAVQMTGDPVVDRWERALARGEVPDLDYRLPGQEQSRV